jgi:diaminopimelate decarboxylase
MGEHQQKYEDLDFGGFTCIESDYLYRHFTGDLAKGDMVVFGNVGSYSIVLKPPFILPNFPVIDISEGDVEIIKRGETFDDLFHTFAF